MYNNIKNKILVIDDQEIIHNDFKKILGEKRINEARNIVNSFLKKEDTTNFTPKEFWVDCASQGKEGFELVSNALGSNEPYKVAFVDMRMPPGWDGLETLKKIFEVDMNIQCVICTAYSDYTWEDMARELGPTDRLLILKKPFDAVEVIQLAYSLTQKWDLFLHSKKQLEGMTTLVTQQSEQVKTVENQLIRSSKLASIGTLAAAVAHEINNPLTVIQGNMDILKMIVSRYKLEDKQLDLIFDRQNNAISRIINIVSGLRSFARVDSEASEVFDLHALILDSISLIENIYQKDDIKFQTDFMASSHYIFANVGRIQQVFMNLFSNARDAMMDKLFDVDVPNKFIKVSSRSQDSSIVVEVEDSGLGISNENLEKIFESFFTTKEAGKGTGLGLSITYKIIKAFGGEISVQSTEGVGSNFLVTLPITSKEFQTKPLVIDDKIKKMEGRVLVVDDEESIRDILGMLLKEAGLEVMTAKSASEAMGYLKKNDFDFVITDFMMPKMKGDELIDKARKLKNCEHTKFILITGCMWSDAELNLDELCHNADALLKKPFPQKEIIALLKKLKS